MITAAAAIMICVFLCFVPLDQRVVKLFGLSLAVAVFLDAFVVRTILVPATLELLGRATGSSPAGWSGDCRPLDRAAGAEARAARELGNRCRCQFA